MSIRGEILGLINAMKPTAAPVTDKAHLYTDLGFDSLEFVRLILRIEEECKISIGIADMESCLRIDRLLALAEAKRKEAAHDSVLIARPPEA